MKTIKIYRGESVIYETPINIGAKGYFSVKTSDYITLPFSSERPIDFKLGDYVNLEGVFDDYLGGKLAKIYEIVDLQKPTYNTETGGYDYSLRLDAYYWKWKNKIFKYTPESHGCEASWSLTAPLDVQMGVFLRNIKALGYKYKDKDFELDIDSTVENKAVTMTYDNTNLLDALFLMADENAWNCDVWITDNIIHFGRNEFGDAVKIERDIEAQTITRNDSQGTYATRIYAFGSTRNIPSNYRPVDEQVVVNGVVQRRLMLPADTPYIDAYEGIKNDEIVETVVVFDDVYPRRVGKVSDVHTRSEEVENEDGTKETITYYRYKDTGLTFSDKYIIEGEELKIHFQSGKLNGMEFGVIFNPSPKDSTRGEQLWEIVRNEDYGRPLPDDILKPENGDKYVLSGFDIQMVSDVYISDAEQELKEKAQKYADKAKKDDGTYPVTLRSDWVEADPISRTFEFGQRINLVDDTYFPNGRISRVLGWELNLDIPWDSPIYTIGESMPYSRVGEIEDKVDALTYKGQTYSGLGGSGVYLIRVNDTTPSSDSNVYSALRSNKEFLNKNKIDRAKKKIIFDDGLDIDDYEAGVRGGRIDGKANAELLSLVVRAFLASPDFRNGMTGEGWKIWLEDGLAKMELDELTVRRVTHFFEVLIEKVRSVGGQICVSSANGKIKTVEDVGDSYLITFEQPNSYLIGDYMRCATYSNGNEQHGYWVKISESQLGTKENPGYVVVPKREFDGWAGITEVGDETVLMGSKNKLRQNLILISATEDGQPRIDVMNGIGEKNFNKCLRTRLGNLDGIQDSWFPPDNQPHGDGLYADNAYLRGTFLLSTGEDIKTKFGIIEGLIQSSIEGVRNDFMQDKGFLNNPTFYDGLNHWTTQNDTVFFLFGNKWIWANNNLLSRKGDSASIVLDGGKRVVLIKNKSIVQKLSDYRSLPSIGTNSDGKKEPIAVYLSFFYKVRRKGTLTIEFKNVNNEGFVEYEPFKYEKELDSTDTYQQFTMSGLWNGTGDFSLSFSGEIYVYMLVLSEDEIESLTYKYRTLLEQSEKLVKIAAQNFDKDGNVLQESGIMVKPEGSGIYVVDKNGVGGFIGVSVEEDDGNGGKKSVVKITANDIIFEGAVTANGNFKILEDGSIEAKNGVFTGEINANKGRMGGFLISEDHIGTTISTYNDNGDVVISEDKTGLFIYKDKLGFTEQDRQIVIGTFEDYQKHVLCRLTDTYEYNSGISTSQFKYGIIFNIDNASIGNFAFAGKGSGLLDGIVEGYAYQKIFLDETDPILEPYNLAKSNKIILRAVKDDRVLALPRLSSIIAALNLFNIVSQAPFSFRITFIGEIGSNGFHICGRNKWYSVNNSYPFNTSDYPVLLSWAGGRFDKVDMEAGNSLEILLVYDPDSTTTIDGWSTKYTARILNRME